MIKARLFNEEDHNGFIIILSTSQIRFASQVIEDGNKRYQFRKSKKKNLS